MNIAIVSDAAALEQEWWTLWHRAPAATPFQTPAWLLPWRRHFAAGEDFILTVRDHGRLTAILPLFRHGGRLMPWGAGTTDWLDGIFDDALDPGVLSRGMGMLPFPVDLFQLRPDSPLLSMPAPEGWEETRSAAESCAILRLPAALPAKMEQNLRYYRRRAERAGITEPDAAGAAGIDALAELHTRRWNERDEPGVFADARVLAWQQEALPALEAAGLLRLYALRLQDRIVAALCVLAAKQRAYYYIGGFDPEFSALGLGTVLVGHAIAEAERAGDCCFDFLRGREAYKYRWGATDQPSHARYLTPPDRPVHSASWSHHVQVGHLAPTGKCEERAAQA